METLKYFISLDIVILELYGLSETNGPQTMNYYDGAYKLGTAGRNMKGTKTRWQLYYFKEDGYNVNQIKTAINTFWLFKLVLLLRDQSIFNDEF